MNRILKNKEDCSGCGACYNVCPRNSINMIEDETGFLYPIIDTTTCVKCGLCEKACPSLNYTEKGDAVKDCFVAYSYDELRKVSSSGGVFSLLAKNVLENDGVVFGAAFDKSWNVHHIMVENTDGLELLKGSKYVQSNTNDTFRQVKKKLEEGRVVLYSGTACQIAGLKKYLEKDYENLCLIDVLCHGAPSPKVWRLYLKKYGNNILDISFRNKKEGWRKYYFSVEVEGEEGIERIDNRASEDMYMKMFLGNISLRPSCFSCKYKKLDRDSDLSLGDCWGIERFMPEMDDDKGTSVVLIHSEKGEKLFEQIKESIKFKRADVKKALALNIHSRKPVNKHVNYKKYMTKLSETDDFDELVQFMHVNVVFKLARKVVRAIAFWR